MMRLAGPRCLGGYSRAIGCARIGGARFLCAKPPKDVASSSASADDAVATEVKRDERGIEVKNWGSSLELPEVSKEVAHERFLDTTDVKRALKPAIKEAVEARDDMLRDRFNYVDKHLGANTAERLVQGKTGAVAPNAVGQNAAAMATVCVLLAGITGAVYVKTQWGVSSGKDLGDKLRERGQSRREAIEDGSVGRLTRTLSQRADATVKANVDLVRTPSQQIGKHFDKSFSQVVKNTNKGTAEPAGQARAPLKVEGAQ